MEDTVLLGISAKHDTREHKAHEQISRKPLPQQRSGASDSTVSRFRSLRGSDQQYITTTPSRDSSDTRGQSTVSREEPSDNLLPLRNRHEYRPQVTYARSDSLPQLWTPFWLRKPTLCLFAILFLGFIAGLVVLWKLSRILNGFPVKKSTSHYAWTYGPTALLVIVVSLWRQIDYNCKCLAPWNELRKGPVPASKSLLADYISPLQIVTFYEALKYTRFSVLVTITGFVLLKIMTIFSTGLLVLHPTTIQTPHFTASSAGGFDASSFVQNPWPSDYDNTLSPSEPVYAQWASVGFGLPLPAGVQPSFAYLPVTVGGSDQPIPSNTSYIVETDAFVPSLDCKAMDISIYGGSTSGHFNQSSQADFGFLYYSFKDGEVCDYWPRNKSVLPIVLSNVSPAPSRSVRGAMERIGCANEKHLDLTSTYQHEKMLFTIADMNYTQFIFPNQTIVNGTRSLVKAVSVLCQPSYYIGRARIVNDTSRGPERGVHISLVNNTSRRQLDHFSPLNLTNLYFSAFARTRRIFGDVVGSQSTEQIANTPFQLMALQHGSTDLRSLLDPANFTAAAEATFAGIMSYYAMQELISPPQHNLTVEITFNEDRLFVSSISLWVMTAGFAVLFIFTLGLLVLSSGSIVPRFPSSIAANATILTRSTELKRILGRQEELNEHNTTAVLTDFQYGTAIATTDQGSKSFKIVVFGETGSSAIKRFGSFKWWLPITVTFPVLAITFTIPIVMIVVLEILQRKSNQDQGLLSISGHSTNNIYVRFIPALVFLLVATLINALDFNIVMFSPWRRLANGCASAKSSLLPQLLGTLPPVALMEAIRNQYWGAVCSTTAATVASIFTIIVSGLFTILPVSSPGPLHELVRADTFDTQRQYNSVSDNGAAAVLTMVRGLNLSFPAGTYDELAMPIWSPGDLKGILPRDSLLADSLTATVPALRGNLRCDVLPSSSINITYTDSSDVGRSFVVTSVYELPKECAAQVGYRNASAISWNNYYTVDQDHAGEYGANMMEFMFGKDGSSPPVGCASLGFIFGRYMSSETPANTTTALVCYQEIQQLKVNATFSSESAELDTSRPPKVVEGSVTVLPNPNSATGAKSFDFRIGDNIAKQETGLNGLQHKNISTRRAGMRASYDSFFTWVFNGTDSIDPDTLVGPSNQQKLQDTINHMYRQYMAQVIHYNMRDPAPQAGVATVMNATNSTRATDVSRFKRRQAAGDSVDAQTTIITTRLIQNQTSKLVLQILLGISTLLGILACFLTPMRHLLPLNPCTIAGCMSLLAGSDLCHSVDDNICSCCGKPRGKNADARGLAESETTHIDREQIIVDGAEFFHDTDFRRVFDGKRYSMGWWGDTSNGGRRRFGVDIGAQPDGYDDDESKIWSSGRRYSDSDGLLRVHDGSKGFAARGREVMGMEDQRGEYHRAEDVSEDIMDHEGDVGMEMTRFRSLRHHEGP